VKTAVAAAVSAFGHIDICVNAAGVAPAHRVVAKTGELFPIELFRFTVEVNLIGTFDVVRQVAAVMAANQPGVDGERGVIINVASIAAFEGQVGQAAYSASKAGVAGMTLPLARDLASVGIRVNTIAPGIMDTPMLATAPQALKDSLAQVHVFPRRLGTPADFAGLVLAIVENSMLNGETIRLDAAARMGPR
jgi:3-hydroxyacyl-CoA dehydrogenase/3-hydroxy-2-methylbutyryl-CoA dehydrogenase